ncbi:MAG: 3-deoxy-D-manno-octulosonate 8-phosphate phosphatase [Flavobacteriaceae bacterium]|jgi:3-deoxy-D-manno-octulosonate 8-phosphate phosphatase (KDO 8-P phosphatase)|nr:3-deoxy-D-manno-octulosonate 8-phosphate phosphatase [Flavobacteriaceae bacterium]|tara:strand:+ start:473 stop:982 length:510 start_codon:yes stop_codon:yes gene_type:complete
MENKNYKELLKEITTFILDVDGVLTNGKILVTSKGKMLREMNTKDGFIIKYALDKGFKIFIISGGTNKGVKERLKDLGIEEIFLGEHTKKDTYDKLIKKYNLKKNEIVYMGDDIPDIPVMKKIGVPCCPNDAVPDVKQISIYISKKNGGQGCVRDIIEQTLRVQNKWLT